MRNSKRFRILLMTFLFSFGQLFAQPGRGLNKGNLTQLYDTTTVETITGEITKIETVQSGYSRFPGTLLTLNDKKQGLIIYVAPDWYIKQGNLKFEIGKSITITGSRITFQNKLMYITKDASFNNTTVIIRNENGVPVWAGKRQGPGRGRRVRR